MSCALSGGPGFAGKVERITVHLANRSGSPIDMTCTLVDGIHDGQYSPSRVRTTSVGTTEFKNIEWTANADNGGARYTVPAASCLLPPATEVVGLSYAALEEVGN